MSASHMGYLKCERCGVMRPPKAVIQTIQRVSCIDVDVCKKLQATGKLATVGPNDDPPPIGGPVVHMLRTQVDGSIVETKVTQTVAVDWTATVQALRDHVPRHGAALATAKHVGINLPIIGLSFAPEHAFHRSLVFGVSKKMIEQFISARIGIEVELLDLESHRPLSKEENAFFAREVGARIEEMNERAASIAKGLKAEINESVSPTKKKKPASKKRARR